MIDVNSSPATIEARRTKSRLGKPKKEDQYKR